MEVLFNNAGSYLHSQADNERALPLLEKALKMAVAANGKEHPKVGLALNNLSGVYEDLGRSKDAMASANRAVEVLTRSKRIKQKYAVELGKAYSNRGRLQIDSDARAARRDVLEAYRLHSSYLGSKHYSTGIDLNNLGTIDRAEQNWSSAYEKFSEVVEIHRGVLPPGDYRLAIALMNKGQMALFLHRPDEALECLTEAVEMFDSLGPGMNTSDHPGALIWLGEQSLMS